MTLLILAIVGACAGAALACWRPPRMPRANLLLAVAVAPQIAAMLGVRAFWAFLISSAAIGLWCFFNRAIAGVPLITIGAAMNLLTMALHGGAMPLHAGTIAALGQTIAPGTILVGSKDVIVQSSPLGLLADWLVFWVSSGKAVIASPGDLIVIAGILYWLLVSPSQRKDQLHAPRVNTHAARSQLAHPSRFE
jgi:hypothetical protein